MFAESSNAITESLSLEEDKPLNNELLYSLLLRVAQALSDDLHCAFNDAAPEFNPLDDIQLKPCRLTRLMDFLELLMGDRERPLSRLVKRVCSGALQPSMLDVSSVPQKPGIALKSDCLKVCNLLLKLVGRLLHDYFC